MANTRIVLITGATSGIGKESAIALARSGMKVIFTARTQQKGEVAQREINDRSGTHQARFLVCDLASLNSVRHLVAQFLQQNERLDVLINNAGVMEQERHLSQDGFEMDFAVNYLAPFLLTNLLLPLLKASAPSRIVNVSSSLHWEGVIDFDDLQGEKHFDRYKAYAQSKLALILFTKKLAAELGGSGVTINALHPGVIGTELTMRNVRTMNPLSRFLFKRTFITPTQGAKTTVYLATAPEVSAINGEYFNKGEVVSVLPAANDHNLAERLWDVSARLVGL